MKKTYQTPNTRVVKIQVISHLLDLSAGGTASIGNGKTDGNAFARESNSWDIWSDDDLD